MGLPPFSLALLQSTLHEAEIFLKCKSDHLTPLCKVIQELSIFKEQTTKSSPWSAKPWLLLSLSHCDPATLASCLFHDWANSSEPQGLLTCCPSVCNAYTLLYVSVQMSFLHGSLSWLPFLRQVPVIGSQWHLLFLWSTYHNLMRYLAVWLLLVACTREQEPWGSPTLWIHSGYPNLFLTQILFNESRKAERMRGRKLGDYEGRR